MDDGKRLYPGLPDEIIMAFQEQSDCDRNFVYCLVLFKSCNIWSGTVQGGKKNILWNFADKKSGKAELLAGGLPAVGCRGSDHSSHHSAANRMMYHKDGQSSWLQ